MAWIESHQSLRNHPKLLELCSKTGWEIETAIGKLHFLWWWALDYAPDGNLSKFNNQTISMAMNIKEDSLRDVLGGVLDVLCKTGWVNEDTKLIHDWWDYAGRFLKIKYKNYPEKWQVVEAMYNGKDIPKNTPKGYPKTPNQPTNQPNQPCRNTLPFQSDEFYEAWKRWLDYNKEKCNPLIPMTIGDQLSHLSLKTEKEAIDCITFSIRNNYKGLFSEKQNLLQPSKPKQKLHKV